MEIVVAAEWVQGRLRTGGFRGWCRQRIWSLLDVTRDQCEIRL